MKGNMMILAPLWFLLCWMSPEGSMAVDAPIPLSMMEDSVDDMYSDCRKEMWKLVHQRYLKKEKKIIRWDDEKVKKCSERPGIDGLTEDHKRAICIYSGPTYKVFNDAVRTQAANYGSTFKYHSLHFLLTSAIQILNPDHKKCFTVYRRTKVDFTGKVNTIIRFGSFASTSLKKKSGFGSKTCFVIDTRFGAYVNDYSLFPNQKEVLIPPYEMFKITKFYDGKGKYPDKELEDCDKVFVLKSAGPKSNLNCILFIKN